MAFIVVIQALFQIRRRCNLWGFNALKLDSRDARGLSESSPSGPGLGFETPSFYDVRR